MGWGQRGGGGGGGSDLSLNAVLFVPKWSGLSSPFLDWFSPLIATAYRDSVKTDPNGQNSARAT